MKALLEASHTVSHTTAHSHINVCPFGALKRPLLGGLDETPRRRPKARADAAARAEEMVTPGVSRSRPERQALLFIEGLPRHGGRRSEGPHRDVGPARPTRLRRADPTPAARLLGNV